MTEQQRRCLSARVLVGLTRAWETYTAEKHPNRQGRGGLWVVRASAKQLGPVKTVCMSHVTPSRSFVGAISWRS